MIHKDKDNERNRNRNQISLLWCGVGSKLSSSWRRTRMRLAGWLVSETSLNWWKSGVLRYWHGEIVDGQLGCQGSMLWLRIFIFRWRIFRCSCYSIVFLAGYCCVLFFNGGWLIDETLLNAGFHSLLVLTSILLIQLGSCGVSWRIWIRVAQQRLEQQK